MSKTVKIRKGANIPLSGSAEKVKGEATFASSFAIKPTDFHGLIPKLVVKQGAEVKAGSVLFYDKYNEHVKFVSPVSGEVAEVVRGEKRKILEVRIVADSNQAAETFDVSDVSTGEKVKQALLAAGYWPFIKQRPYDVIADPKDTPKSIFVSGFDSAPLGPDYDFALHGQNADFQKGIDALKTMTNGAVHLSTRPGGAADTVFGAASGVEKNTFSGPHPAGNVGIQIHHIDPVNKGERVWAINAQAVAMIGRFLNSGKADFSKTIALAGSQVEKPRYFTTHIGASAKSIVDGKLVDGDNRVISGNPLTGSNVGVDGYLGFYDDVVSVLPEGKEPQFLGWIAPNFNKFSLSRSYFSWLMPKKGGYALNTSMNGEDRAFVVSGEYENVLPMDIYPVYLLKAIMTKDIEKMENLGIYEIAPEDMALCEYACTSKIEVQNIVRSGIDLAIQELG